VNLVEMLIDTHTRVCRIEGEMTEIRRLPDRVSMLEQCQAWLKGGWAILAAGYAYLFRGLYTR